jgi:glycosyltransferase involved in cell wall biosynthesis
MLPITVWMNYPSLHQGDLFRALASVDEIDLEVIFARGLPDQRVRFGWRTDLEGYRYLFLKRGARMIHAMRLAWLHRHRFHIVNGIWGEPSFTTALMVLAAVGGRYAIYSEAPEPDLPRSFPRRFLRDIFGKLLAPRATGALSISQMAVDFFETLGISRAAIYPFGYFRSKPTLRFEPRPPETSRIEIVYCGQIIHRKGIDLLIDAVRPLLEEEQNVFLKIIGTGELEPYYKNLVRNSKLASRIEFEGVVAPDQMPSRIARADILVLPSRWDGWGVVVNEALSVGVPVVVSDRCGAADLIVSGANGFVFKSGDVDDLRACLTRLLELKAQWPVLKGNASATGQRISVEEVTPYLADCLKYMTGSLRERPEPPWNLISIVEPVSLTK